MATYRVRQALDAYRPARWAGTDYERRFGPDNEGFTLEAASLEDARALLRSGEAGHRLNPGLLSITLEESGQLDLDGRATPPPRITAALEAIPELKPPPVQLGLDIDRGPVAIRLPRGLGIAYQDTLGGAS